MSVPGYAKVVSIMAMEHVRRALMLLDAPAIAHLFDPERYCFRIFGTPGGAAPGERHYYRVQGPDLLIEHDNTQGGGNHVHSVWRNPDNDCGDDILAAHYRAEHR